MRRGTQTPARAEMTLGGETTELGLSGKDGNGMVSASERLPDQASHPVPEIQRQSNTGVWYGHRHLRGSPPSPHVGRCDHRSSVLIGTDFDKLPDTRTLVEKALGGVWEFLPVLSN
ncbi:hypothetical protein PDE_04623 [Penicillium oxalicum 114-2]|uniref:Uncharacterized protein n=1 Tax=Penicillium oxalicum (strain 114-2 / CGMCC 5302) TaxID=933388 RepID=S8AU43_PENO1|nr:hypothetical protein PDE_04623 [Penicillium oxalicum 114-2]